MSDKELVAWESSRDIAAELEQSINEMLTGQGKAIVITPVAEVRLQTGLSQSLFAKLLGVSVRTLQEWEQGRRKPSGAAQTLITIAQLHPEILAELAAT
ncbi:helix-turn-helix domain-containing protein [Solimicrobium silvestre]|nr:helix-turn-helix domain-containing protein [Solimicrobium silvestre]